MQSRSKEVARVRARLSSLIDIVNAIADSECNIEEHEIRDVENHLTFIDTVNDKTNIDIVVSDAKGNQEARDDLRKGLGSVQERDHAVAGIVGAEDKPPQHLPRVTYVSLVASH